MQKGKKELAIKVVLHVLVWAVLLGLPFYSARRVSLENDFLLIFYSFTLINALIFYSNYLFLVPGLFFQKRKFRYYISVIGLLVVFYFISDYTSDAVFGYLQRVNAERPMPLQPPRSGLLGIRLPPGKAHLMGYMSSSLFMLFMSLGLKVLERQSKIEKMQEEMEKAKLNAELALLKNQISPHFFFNTLNNIYSLIGINAEDSQKAVLKLSKLMRYLLYESEQGDTKLSKELDFMKNYIDLMKLRISEKIKLSVTLPQKYEDINIPPLLFIPFIENAFKHGVAFRDNSFIEISLDCSANVINFRCFNSFAPNKNDSSPEPSGIGLGNVKKRLELLFPGKYELIINNADEIFEVLLKIRLLG